MNVYFITRAEAEGKLGLKVTSITLQIFIRYDDHHPLTPAHINIQLFAKLDTRMATRDDISPLLYEFTCNGPNAGTRENISVKHTQLQLVVRLLQLSDHLADEMEVVLAVADEGVKHLRRP